MMQKQVESKDHLFRSVWQFAVEGNVVRLMAWSQQTRPTRRHKYRDFKTWTPQSPGERPWVPQYLIAEVLSEARSRIVWEGDL